MLASRAGTAHSAQAIVVLGMHRSGTSLVTRLLNLAAGADLPRHLMNSSQDNEAGFWESQPIADFNEELLEAAKSAWDDPSPTPESWLRSEAAAPWAEKLTEILEAEFSGSSFFVVKDPRISRLVSLWVRALEAFSAEPHFVITVRNPLEVAASLRVRDGFPPAKSSLLWLWHVLEAEHHTRGYKRSFVSYEELLADWRPALSRLLDDLDLRWPQLSEETIAQVNGFLSDGHRHHRCSPSDVDSDPHLTPWVERTYSAILSVADNPETRSEALDTVRDELLVADATFGPILTALQLEASEKLKEVHRLGAELGTTNQEVATLHAELGATNREVATLHAELGSTNQEVTALNATLEKVTRGLAAQIAERSASAERAEMLWASKPWQAYMRLANMTRRLLGSSSERQTGAGDKP